MSSRAKQVRSLSVGVQTSNSGRRYVDLNEVIESELRRIENGRGELKTAIEHTSTNNGNHPQNGSTTPSKE